MRISKFIVPALLASIYATSAAAQQIPDDKMPKGAETYLCEGSITIDGKQQAVLMEARQPNPDQYIFLVHRDIMKDTPYKLDRAARWPYAVNEPVFRITVNGANLGDDTVDNFTQLKDGKVATDTGWDVKANKSGITQANVDTFNVAMKLNCAPEVK